MLTDITHVTLLVDDQDEALSFYTETLGLVKRDDVQMEETEIEGEWLEMEMEGEWLETEMEGGWLETEMEGRWLTVSPESTEFPQIALTEADTAEKRERVGSQVADHVNLVFTTDDFDAEYERLREAGVEFHGEPTENPWGTEAVFEDPYGNVHDLLEPAG